MAGFSPGAAAIHLGRMLPSASCNLPGRLTRKLIAGLSPSTPSLFGFAPGGVCHAAAVTSCAVGSYPTLSPLPRHSLRPVHYPLSQFRMENRFTLFLELLWTRRNERRGGFLSVALSLGSPPPDVIRHRVSLEPGLSSHAAFRLMTCAAARPAGDPYKCVLR
jgi:hypothetical protein